MPLPRLYIAAFLIVLALGAIDTSAQRLAPSVQKRAHSELNVAILGDSNCWISGDDCSGDKGWPKWFVDVFAPASCRSFARSGATWTNTSRTVANLAEDIAVLGDNNVVYNQVMRLVEACSAQACPEPDVVIIAAGTNDAWFARKRPNAFVITPFQAIHNRWDLTHKQPDQVLTLAESVVFNCQLIMQHFPAAKILLVGPAQATTVSEQAIASTNAIIEGSGQSLHLSTVRLDRLSPIRRTKERARHTYTSDGVHTNAKGAKANAEIITWYVDQLLN